MVLLKSHRWGRALFDDGRGRMAHPGRKLQVVKRSLLARRLLLRGLLTSRFLRRRTPLRRFLSDCNRGS